MVNYKNIFNIIIYFTVNIESIYYVLKLGISKSTQSHFSIQSETKIIIFPQNAPFYLSYFITPNPFFCP